MADISPQSAKRIAASVRWTERRAKNEPLQRGRSPAFNNPGVKIATTSSIITANVGARPGTGTAVLQSYDGPGHDVAATSVTVTVSNIAGAIPSGTKIYIAFGDGGWHVVVYPCTT